MYRHINFPGAEFLEMGDILILFRWLVDDLFICVWRSTGWFEKGGGKDGFELAGTPKRKNVIIEEREGCRKSGGSHTLQIYFIA